MMETSLEHCLYQSILANDEESAAQHLKNGANPNIVTSFGKTCLGEAASTGNISILILMLEFCSSENQIDVTFNNECINTQRCKSQKRKLDVSYEDYTVKCKSISDKDVGLQEQDNKSTMHTKIERRKRNCGYYVFNHDFPSLKKTPSPVDQTPSPVIDLEWDEDIGSAAPVTSEDETWSSMYRWYAGILENTGESLACAALITSGIDQLDMHKMAAIHYAAKQGHLAAVQLLIDAGCKMDIIGEDFFTPLHFAVIGSHKSVVKLLAHYSRIDSITDKKMSPLHFAALMGDVEIAEILVQAGAPLEVRNVCDGTPLYLAAKYKQEQVVRYLVNAGANVNTEDSKGRTPLNEAVWSLNTSMAEFLLQAGARLIFSHKLMQYAIMKQNDDMVKLLAKYCGGLNLRDEFGNTPLLFAIMLSKSKIVRLLLESGANIYIRNNLTGANAWETAIDYINSAKVFEEIILCLLDFKMGIDYKDSGRETPLSRALSLFRNNAAMLLVKHGADVNLWKQDLDCVDNLNFIKEVASPNLVDMIMKAGHYVPHLGLGAHPKPGTTAYIIYQASKNPLSLYDISRINIRKLANKRIMHTFIHSLPVPQTIQKFLMLEELCILQDNPD